MQHLCHIDAAGPRLFWGGYADWLDFKNAEDEQGKVMSNGGPHSQGDAQQFQAQEPWGTNVPNVARIYDHYLGGRDNYAQDREAARKVLGTAPDVPLAALENREFLKRAVNYLANEEGVEQFIDIGPGLPTQGNIHQLARQHNPQARVLYVDNDPVVVAHGRELLHHVRGARIIDGDLRRLDDLLGNWELHDLVDLSRPVALSMSLILHFITENEDPYGIVARLRDALCPGSYMVLSHVTGDGREIKAIRKITQVYDSATAPLVPRAYTDIMKFFRGFELIEPGVVFLSQWRPTTEYSARGGTRWAYAGVGRKAEA